MVTNQWHGQWLLVAWWVTTQTTSLTVAWLPYHSAHKHFIHPLVLLKLKLETIFGCWWQNFDLGDIFWTMDVGDQNDQNCHQHIPYPTSVTNIDVTLTRPWIGRGRQFLIFIGRPRRKTWTGTMTFDENDFWKTDALVLLMAREVLVTVKLLKLNCYQLRVTNMRMSRISLSPNFPEFLVLGRRSVLRKPDMK